MRYYYGFGIGVALGAVILASLGVSAWWFFAFFAGGIGGLGAQSLPDWRSWPRRRVDRQERELTSATGPGVRDWLVGEVRRAGINASRSGGVGTVLTAPVLVTWRTGWRSVETTIYDQHGNLLAATGKTAASWQWLREGGEVKVVDARGRSILTVIRGGSGTRTSFSAVGVDGSELGMVSLADLSIIADGEVVGWVRPARRRGVAFARGRFAIEDQQKSVVGHVTRTAGSGLWSTCNVIEFDERAPAAVRGLALAINEAVNVWLAPSGGSGGGGGG